MSSGNYHVLLTISVFCAAAAIANAQSSILGTNLIVNGNAESGPAGTGVITPVATIPGWTVAAGNPTVLPYNLTGYVQTTDPSPPDHGFQYFAAAFLSNPCMLTQNIDVSSVSSLINAGNAKFTASAYLGSAAYSGFGGEMDVAFKNSDGQTFSTTKLGPVSFPFAGDADGMSNGMFFQQQIGLVPQGTVTVTITLILEEVANVATEVADSLSLVLTQVATTPTLGTNLIVNPGAEMGPAVPLPAPVEYIPGWSTMTQGASVAPYGGPNWDATTAPGPPDRGVNVFAGWRDTSDLYQDIDVSGAASLIDSNQVPYSLSAWLGGTNISNAATLTYIFYDWSGKQLAPTAQLVPLGTYDTFQLLQLAATGPLPSGTRRVHISLNFVSSISLADNINFTLIAPNAPPVITTGGIVSASAFGAFPTIAPGTWIEIYGSNLAPDTRAVASSDIVNGVLPTTLDGVSVSVGGAAAFMDYISPGQINVLVPSNAASASGTVDITVTNAIGMSDPFGIYINATEPGLLAPASFTVGGKQYVAALFQDGQTYALPTGAIPGVPSHPASPGDVLTIYGIGFGPVTGGFTAGTLVTAQNSLTKNFSMSFGSTAATLDYDGLAPNLTGLYQFDVVVPNVGNNNAEPISFTLGNVKSTQTLYIAVQN